MQASLFTLALIVAQTGTTVQQQAVTENNKAVADWTAVRADVRKSIVGIGKLQDQYGLVSGQMTEQDKESFAAAEALASSSTIDAAGQSFMAKVNMERANRLLLLSNYSECISWALRSQKHAAASRQILDNELAAPVAIMKGILSKY